MHCKSGLFLLANIIRKCNVLSNQIIEGKGEGGEGTL